MKRNYKPKTFKGELLLSFLTITLVSILLLGAFQIYQLSSLVNEDR